jgi:hypothetical protein
MDSLMSASGNSLVNLQSGLAKEIRDADDREAAGRKRPLLEHLRRWLITARR